MVSELLPIESLNNVDVVDSRLIAQELGISHSQFYRTIKENETDIEQTFGRVCFKNESLNTAGGMQ
jgi:phage regulator Rha-like protein